MGETRAIGRSGDSRMTGENVARDGLRDGDGRFSMLMAAVEAIPPLPRALFELHTQLRDKRNSAVDVVDVVGADASLARTVVRAANSARFGMPGRTFSLKEAVVRLGRAELRTMVASEMGIRVLGKPLPAYSLDAASLARNGVAGAIAARAWARVLNDPDVDPESAYLAGILRDVGKRAVAEYLPPHLAAERDAIPPSAEFLKLEEAHAGFNHAELSAVVAHRSGVAPAIAEAIEWHHKPSRADQAQLLSVVVHLGDATALLTDSGLGVDLGFYDLDPIVFDLLPSVGRRIEDIMSATVTELKHVEAALGINASRSDA